MPDDLGLVAFWVFVAVAVVGPQYFRFRTRENRDRIIQALAEKGQPIPQELLAVPGNDKSQRNSVYTAAFLLRLGGTFFVAIAVALGVFLWIISSGAFDETLGPKWLPFVAIFPLAIGVAILIGYAGRPHDDRKQD